MSESSKWPALPSPDVWEDTLRNIHMWSQIVGKIRLENSPWINHSWHATFYISARGMTTGLIPNPSKSFEITFDFISHKLQVETTAGESGGFDLVPMTVADFYKKFTALLNKFGLPTKIYSKPVEVPDPILSFDKDDSVKAYDAETVNRYWLALAHIHRVFSEFRAGYLGKTSPVHLFWGAFDLAVTRFSGREAPEHPAGIPNCPDWVMKEAYSHEVSSAGFWAGGGYGEAAFYAYAYPEPEGYRKVEGLPKGSEFFEPLGEFVLPYEAVRSSKNPDKTLLDFLNKTWRSAAENGSWDTTSLEFSLP